MSGKNASIFASDMGKHARKKQLYCQLCHKDFNSSSSLINMVTGKWKRITHMCINDKKATFACFKERNGVPNALYLVRVAQFYEREWLDSPLYHDICSIILEANPTCDIPFYKGQEERSSSEEIDDFEMEEKKENTQPTSLLPCLFFCT